jgi:hypothetical protein
MYACHACRTGCKLGMVFEEGQHRALCCVSVLGEGTHCAAHSVNSHCAAHSVNSQPHAQDLTRIDPDRARDVRVTLVEAMQLLGSFDSPLREYAARTLHRQGIHLVHGMVKVQQPPALQLLRGQPVH